MQKIDLDQLDAFTPVSTVVGAGHAHTCCCHALVEDLFED